MIQNENGDLETVKNCRGEVGPAVDSGTDYGGSACRMEGEGSEPSTEVNYPSAAYLRG